MKPGDLRIGLGDGSIGGKIFLITAVSKRGYDPFITALVDGKLEISVGSWFEIKTRPVENDETR